MFREPKKTRKWTKMTKGVNIDLAGDMIKGIVETLNVIISVEKIGK